jgi:SAM-dependent MidA family methyltransferase
LADPGQQDLTAHVNFSALRRVGEACGLSTESLKTQGQFLTTIFADMYEKRIGKDWNQEQVRQFQTLTHPAHLGHTFKVFEQVKR